MSPVHRQRLFSRPGRRRQALRRQGHRVRCHHLQPRVHAVKSIYGVFFYYAGTQALIVMYLKDGAVVSAVLLRGLRPRAHLLPPQHEGLRLGRLVRLNTF